MSMDSKEEKLKLANNEDTDMSTKKQAVGKEKKSPRRGTRPAGMDPYVRVLFGVAGLVVIGALLTVIFAYLSGVIDFDQSRATNIDEFSVASSEAYALTEGTAGAFSQLAIAQIVNGRLIEAEQTIQQAFDLNSPDEERNQAPLFASALLAEAQGNDDLAIERFEDVMSRLREDFDHVYHSDLDPNWARAFGMHPNYYESAIALSKLYHKRSDYEKQIEMLDIAVEGMPTMADIFLLRGQAKLAQGDNEGAIEDFNEVLRFIPDNEIALAGLEEAGGSVND